MSKLLREPRPLKEIIVPKKRVKRIKRVDTTDLPIECTVIRESNRSKVDELFRMYKEDPFKARVKYFNSDKQYWFTRLVIFTHGPEDFMIVEYMNKFGISISNKIYSSERKERWISYKNGKFYMFINQNKNKSIIPLSFKGLANFIMTTERSDSFNSKTLKYFKDRFSWIRMLSEVPASHNVSFNTIVAKKIFSGNDMLRHVFKVPKKIAKMFIESKSYDKITYESNGRVSRWNDIIKQLINIEYLKPELLDHKLFLDTCDMAKTLGRKVNCKWGLKRFKQEHDRWSKEITNIVLECEVEYDLRIKPIFVEFANFSKYRLLRTNKDMLREGMVQRHCVGTYISRVEAGICAIYHIDGYTLEVSLKNDTDAITGDKTISLVNVQFRGLKNENAPNELMEHVAKMMADFKSDGGFERVGIDSNKIETGEMQNEWNQVW